MGRQADHTQILKLSRLHPNGKNGREKAQTTQEDLSGGSLPSVSRCVFSVSAFCAFLWPFNLTPATQPASDSVVSRSRETGGQMGLTSKRVRRVVILAVVLVLALAASWAVWNGRTDRNPARVYRRYSSELAAYAERLRAGRVAHDASGEYAMPRFLIERGATHARREGNCLVITFGFMPTDAVPELWYSPTGFDPLPGGIAERKRRAYFNFVPLSSNWAECDWDQ